MEALEAVGLDVAPEVEAPETVETTETVETPEAEVSPESETPESGETEQVEESPVEGKMPPAFKEWLKNLQATDPKTAQRIRGAYFEAQQLRQQFPNGLKDVEGLAKLVETVGGQEGWQAIEAERAEWAALDQKFTSGDPSFVDAISQEDPAAFAKIVPHAITKFSQLDPEGYSHIMAGVVTETIRPYIAEAYNALAGNEQTKAVAQKLADWYNGLDNLAKVKPQPKVDPEREKLQKERQEFEQQKAQEFHQAIYGEMRKSNAAQIESDLRAQFTKNGKDLIQFKIKNPESYAILMENCGQAVQGVLAKDEAFLKQWQTLLQSGDKARAVRLGQAKIKQISPEAVKKTVRAFMAFGGGAPIPAAAKPAAQAPAKTFTLTKQPSSAEIDWSRTTNAMVLSGKAYLKSRKEMVTFP